MSKNLNILREDKMEGSRKFHERAERLNPCQKEHDLSLSCLDKNYYDRHKCENYFANYINCKAFWNYVKKDRKRKGLKPYIPIPEEREMIKKEYLPKFNL